MSGLTLKDFSFSLPEERIAQFPLTKRENARLMVIHRSSGTILHDQFKNVGRHLPAQAHLVLNDSKVIAARLLGRKARNDGKVEIFLLNRLSDGYTYEVLMRPLKRIRAGDEIIFDKSRLKATVIDREKPLVRFSKKNILSDLEKIGHVPLPPYIRRQDTASDRKYYQTVYAKVSGSVASPTAGLHFTRSILSGLKRKGHSIDTVTLHINYGTFKPVEVEDIRRHPMHTEFFNVSKRTWTAVQKSKKQNRPVVAVGTTSCRTLETIAKDRNFKGQTNIFIYPPYTFKMVDCLITNFHLPQSTLLMLVYAFGGVELMKKAYKEAIKKKYRFYSYGDAMLII